MNTKRTSGLPRLSRPSILSSIRQWFRDESGQSLALVAAGMTALMGMGGIAIDVGHVYVVRSQVQNTVNAAALAAAQYVTSPSTASANITTQADAYGPTGSENPIPGVTIAPTVQAVCVNMLMPTGSTCTTSSAANAVRVTETASVKTFFMSLFGIPSINVSATSTASLLGGEAQPWNVAIVLDATGSMNNSDPNCGSGKTQWTCATGALQAMLAAANPCQPGYTTCTTSNSNLRISLFSFPGVSSTSVNADTTNCSATPTFMQYTLPLTNSTSYSPLSYLQGLSTWTGTYQIVPFSSDYYSTTAANHLNSTSPLVEAVNGCMSPISNSSGSSPGYLNPGLQGTTGGVTYLAPPIYAAQAALLAAQAANPHSKNALILLSDGQSNLQPGAKDLPGENGATLLSGLLGLVLPTHTGSYPDDTDECQQSIVAAQSAAAAGTRVYSVAYGAESQGCSYTTPSNGSAGSYGTDNTTVATGQNAPFTAATISPCLTMENIASNMQYFYSDYNQSNSGNSPDRNCIDSAHPVSSLNDILLSIVQDFTRPRLIPNNAPYVVVSN